MRKFNFSALIAALILFISTVAFIAKENEPWTHVQLITPKVLASKLSSKSKLKPACKRCSKFDQAEAIITKRKKEQRDSYLLRLRATSIGVFRFWRDFGYVVGALLTGIFTDLFSIEFSIGIIGVLTILSALIILYRMHCKPFSKRLLQFLKPRTT